MLTTIVVYALATAMCAAATNIWFVEKGERENPGRGESKGEGREEEQTIPHLTIVVVTMVFVDFLLTNICFWNSRFLMVFRFLSALGIGGEWATGAALVRESLPPNKAVLGVRNMRNK